MATDLLSKPEVTRQDLLDAEEFIKNQNSAVLSKDDPNFFPLKHSFADGMYVREIFIPAGYMVVGKIHKYKHPNFLLSGTVQLITEFETKTLTGPLSIISEAGTKRTLYSVTDLVWVTVHANPDELRDVDELVNLITAETYEELELFLEHKQERIAL